MLTYLARCIMSKNDVEIQTFNKVPDYNGYTNKPTWCVSLWINNDQGLQETVLEAAKNDADLFAGWLEDFIEENNPLIETASLYSDLLGWALCYVDWDELAEHFIEAAEEITD